MNNLAVRMAMLFCLTVAVVLTGSAQTGFYTLNGGTAGQTNQTYAATAADQSAVYVLNSGSLTLTNCTMTKSGDASNVNNSSQYGTNAGVLAKAAGTVTIIGGSVTTNAGGGNGLFASGSGSSVTMSNGTINASGGGAHGVDATYGGSITLTNVDVTTTGSSSSALATDFGGGTVTVTGGTISASSTASGSHSAGIYSTGTISVIGATVTSVADCGGVIDGANSILLTNTALNGNVEGFKLWKTAPASGPATVTINGGSLTVIAGDGFYVTGSAGNAATGKLTVKGGATISVSSGNILVVDKSSTTTFTADSVGLNGNLVTDNTSTITATLQNRATLSGSINSAALTIDATSSWTVTAASNLSTLSDASGISGTSITNITGNGNNVYYDATLLGNSALGGKTYSLVKGGSLLPKGASAVDQAGVELPTTWGLQQNYPNPFNPSTMIRFGLPSRARATLTVFNYLGQKIVQLVDGDLDAGYHEVQFNGAGLASGLYLYTLKVRHLDSSVGSDSKSGTEDFVATKKFILMK